MVAVSSSKKLDVKLIGEMLNKIFNTSTRQNKRILDAFILQHDIEFDGETFPYVTMKWKKKKRKKSKTVNLFSCK